MAALGMAMDIVDSEREFYPGYEEARMARAIASSVVIEALAHGESHVSFRGFRIEAMRLTCAPKNASVIRVELVIRLDGHMIDREVAEILPLHLV